MKMQSILKIFTLLYLGFGGREILRVGLSDKFIFMLHTVILLTIGIDFQSQVIIAQSIPKPPSTSPSIHIDIFSAARVNDRQGVKGFLEKGIKVNEKNAKGFTPLIIAAYTASDDVLILLLESGAEVDLPDGLGNTALMGAALKGNQKIARLLLEKGADINARNKIGVTPLMFAALAGKTEMVKLLTEKGADINAVDQRGFTALMLAAHKGADEIIELFKSLGAVK
ncbi:MAG: ankyrin repeat domain-containing protein [Chloroherpetonaceae bacterium]|nr:ankyrin repeat domain-containing protein [Chloroherpetonaceae bacterium]